MSSSIGKIYDDKQIKENKKRRKEWNDIKQGLIDRINSAEDRYHRVSKEAKDIKWLYYNWEKIMANKRIINLIRNWND